MKFFVLCVAFVIYLVSFRNECNCAEHEANGTATTRIKSVDRFSRDLFVELANNAVASRTSANVFFSPLSIQIALGMLLLGSKGESSRQLLRTISITGRPFDNVEQALRSFRDVRSFLTRLDLILIDSRDLLLIPDQRAASKNFETRRQSSNL